MITNLETDYKSILDNFKISIPEFQRIIDSNKVDEIIEFQLKHNKEKGCFCFLGNLTFCNYNNQYYLIDGQHRYFALKILYDKYSHNIKFNIQIINISISTDIKLYYKIVNKNTELPDIEFDKIDKNILQEVCDYFKQKYPKVWSSSTKSRRPFINYNLFQEACQYLIDKLEIKEPTDLIDILTNHNYLLSTRPLDIRNSKNKKVNITKIYDKAKEWNFFLGFQERINKDYHFQWVDEIIDLKKPKIKNEEVKIKKMKYSKKTIPKSLRNKLWNTYIGINYSQCYCICCNTEKISMQQFHCGHIIPESKGGGVHVNNLLPICGSCNLSMSNIYMEEFIQKYFPESIDNFKNKKYNVLTE